MTVELWYGSWSEHRSEQQVLIDLYEYLHPQQFHTILLSNFRAGQSNEIDLVVLKENAIFVAEIKHSEDKLVGGQEGPWKIVNLDGREVMFPGGANPYKQVIHNYQRLKDWLENNQADFCIDLDLASPPNFKKIGSYIVVHPHLHPNSKLDIDPFPVHAVGLPKFLTTVAMRTMPQIKLSQQEMQKIPQLLGLTRLVIRPRAEIDRDKTLPLDGWKPRPFVALVSVGHEYSDPIFKISGERVSIGRSSENDLMVDHPAVSRRHAELYQQEGRWVIEDLSSLSGTYVYYDGALSATPREIKGDRNALKNGSVVRFGPVAFSLLINE